MNTRADLKLNLAPRGRVDEPLTPSPTSPPSSCVSSDESSPSSVRYSTSPEATSMKLVGCPRCLMYVMLSEEDSKCPKCKSTVLLDVIQQHNNKTNIVKKN